MTNENAAAPKKSRLKKVLRGLMLTGLVAFGAATAAHFAWKHSGSGEWVQVIDKKGITVYTRKVPGAVLKEVKAVRTVRTSLMAAMAAMSESDCSKWMAGCLSATNVVPYDPKNRTTTDLMVVEYPSPYSPREYLLRTQFLQDAKTKVAQMNVQAAPDLLPRRQGFYRIEDVDNRWLFTPLGNGELQVQCTLHMDQGIPYLLHNRIAPIVTFNLFLELPMQFDQYRNAKVDFITE